MRADVPQQFGAEARQERFGQGTDLFPTEAPSRRIDGQANRDERVFNQPPRARDESNAKERDEGCAR